LAWNVLAWNFLSAKREADVKFDPKEWANPNKGGMYISYTYARVGKALKDAGVEAPYPFEPEPVWDVMDVPILGHANYFPYYLKRARKEMDPVAIAQFAFSLALRLGKVMEQRRVIGGTRSFQCALWSANDTLRHCMELLTMYPLERV
jgi:arginyl-tRNA synthetase